MQNGRFPVGMTVWYWRLVMIHMHTQILFMYMHVGGGAWICNIPGGAIQSPGNIFVSYPQEGIGNNCTKLCVNPTVVANSFKGHLNDTSLTGDLMRVHFHSLNNSITHGSAVDGPFILAGEDFTIQHQHKKN